MKAKTKRRIRHVLTKKKLVSRKTSRQVLRTFVIGLATISTGSLAYAIALTKPVVTVSVNGGNPQGRTISAPATPVPPVVQVAVAPSVPQGAVSGRASWYALGLPAPDTLTCASRTYPRGSYLQVTNQRNGRVVVCRVNDYGPAIWTGRIIDLSRGSFTVIDSLGAGTAPVTVRLVSAPASGSVKLPIVQDIASVVGYSSCLKHNSAQYCEAHRQD